MSVREADVTAPPGAVLTGREVALGRYTTVRRLLPDRTRRTIGAWCFADSFGNGAATRDAATQGMWVPPHPHTGLQTVTWLLDGDVLHRDSLGSEQRIVPGQLNLMTAGRGIAHSEESLPGPSTRLRGLQLWVALPAHARDMAPEFAHHADLPVVSRDGVTVTVLAGEVAGAVSPVRVHTPLVGAHVDLEAGADLDIAADPAFEYGVLVVDGAVRVGGTMSLVDGSAVDVVTAGSLLYLEPGREHLRLRTEAPAVAFLLGGVPFEDPLVMWWNFVGPDHESVAAAREDWESGRRFGRVEGFRGDPMRAPAMPTVRLVPRRRDGTSSR